MAKVMILFDMQEGHILPTFGLAHSIRQDGHEVIYTSIADNEQLVREQGFPFFPVLEKIWPKGYRAKHNDYEFLGTAMPITVSFADVLEEAKVFLELYKDADVFMACVHLQLPMILLYHKYHITPVVLTPHLVDYHNNLSGYLLEFLMEKTPEDLQLLRDFLEKETGVCFTSWEEILKPLDTFPELVLCPAELGIGEMPTGENMVYVEPSIRKSGFQDIYELYNIAKDKKIVYASFGSQASSYRERSDHFFRMTAALAREAEFSHLHFILRIRQDYLISELGPIPDNLTVREWLPQLDILNVASAAIVHGGLGTIKECIYYGVPMIVLPQRWDQPYNAKCVAYHNLGVAGDLDSLSFEELAGNVRRVLSDEGMRESMEKMKKIFREKEAARPGAEFIKTYLKDSESLVYEHRSL